MVWQQIGMAGGVATQRAAERDIDFLKAPADAEHRLGPVDHCPDQIDGQRISARIERAVATLPAVMVRLDI